MPFWAVVAEDDHHNAEPCAFILAGQEKASTLAAALRELHEHIPGARWNPNWMIDKDSKEQKALVEKLADLFTNKVPKHYQLQLSCTNTYPGFFCVTSTPCALGRSSLFTSCAQKEWSE